MNKKYSRMLLSLLLIFVVVISITACTTANDKEKETTTIKKVEETEDKMVEDKETTEKNEVKDTDNTSEGKDSLIVAIESEPLSLSTVDNDSLSPIYFHLLTNNLLFRINMDTLDVEPDLVESYENPSDTEWIFKLREGVKFHNGDVLTADDVVASIENAKTYSGSRNYTEQIEKIEAVDELTVKITTPQPYANLLYDLAYHFNYILPKSAIESEHDFSQHPIGTGPYKFVKWTKGEEIELERNDEYFNEDEQPVIKTIIFKFIPEGTSRTLALETGEIDVNFHVEPADVERLKNNENIKVDELMSVENKYLVLNNALPPFDDANLRLAIHCAIDREAIIAGALNGYGTPSFSSIPMGYWGSWEGNMKPFDVDLAKKYIDKWGGDPSEVKLPIIARTDLENRVATIIQANLLEIGINAEVVSMETATWHARRAAGDYTAGITSWSPSNAFTYLIRYDSDKNESIPGSCNSAEVDALIEKMKTTLDDDARLEVMHELVEVVNDVSPQPSLYQEMYFRAYNANLEGIKASATGYMQFHTARWKDSK